MAPVTQTLFIDESGDFDTSPRWIVSGVLCTGEPQTAEKRLSTALKTVRRRFHVDSLADLHLTELRKARGHQDAIDIARAVLTAAEDTGIVTGMLVVENARGEGLADNERTYRLMLLDLLALADTVLPEELGDAPLQLIVARRQRKGTLMSTREDLLADVVERIEDAVEAGLAARGLLGRLNARHVQIWKAADSAGLVLADFVANLTYNRHHREDRPLFDDLYRSGRLRLFEGLGGYAERRARIAERDGDLAAALARWALLDADAASEAGHKAALKHLWQRVLGSGTTGPMATLEAVLERLWRANKAPANHPRLAVALRRLEAALQATKAPPSLLYRLRNLMHQVANQMGNLPMAESIMAAQSDLAASVAADPSSFHLILDEQVFRASTDELRLDFDAAQRHAREHVRLVEQYKTVWELLNGAGEEAGFRNSRLWLKAQMTLARALLLTGESDDLAEADSLLAGLAGLSLADADRSRLLGYQIWLAVRRGEPLKVLTTAATLIKRYRDPFAAQMAARAAADAALLAPDRCNSELRALLSVLRSRADAVHGHPGELLWRDLGLLEQQISGRLQSVRLAFERSVRISVALPKSPINRWNRWVMEIHRAELCGSTLQTIALSKAGDRLDSRARAGVDESGLLQAYRRASPY